MSDPSPAPFDPDRGTGRTTRQMIAAPFGAIFVWCNEFTSYPTQLAKWLDRPDLHVIAPGQLERCCGFRRSMVVVDHATRLTDDQRLLLLRLHG